MSKSLRESMPIVTEFIDECRKVFGIVEVDNAIRLGMQGAETFYASENGHEIGTPVSAPVKYVTADKMVLYFSADQLKPSRKSAR
jgi:hypothetical protein